MTLRMLETEEGGLEHELLSQLDRVTSTNYNELRFIDLAS